MFERILVKSRIVTELLFGSRIASACEGVENRMGKREEMPGETEAAGEPARLLSLAEMQGMSGLEYLRTVAAGKIRNPPIADLMGFSLTEVEFGKVVFSGAPSRDVYNLIETVHGGYAATLLDSAMACAILASLDPETSFTTLEIKINYVRAMTAESGVVSATGTAIQVGRKVATAEGRLTDAQGKLLAFGTTTCLIVPK
jgi:uncharacterized protein (TIGR00369 family)